MAGTHLLAPSPPPPSHAVPGQFARPSRGSDPFAPAGLLLRADEQVEAAPPGGRAVEEGRLRQEETPAAVVHPQAAARRGAPHLAVPQQSAAVAQVASASLPLPPPSSPSAADRTWMDEQLLKAKQVRCSSNLASSASMQSASIQYCIHQEF